MNHYEQLALWSEVASSIIFALALIFGFNKYLTPAVLAAQRQRNEELIAAERERDQAKADLERARAEHAEIEIALLEMGRRARSEADHERTRIVAEARSEGERVVRNADGELERARFSATEAFRQRILVRAIEAGRKRAEATIDASVDRRIVGQFVDTMNEDREFATAGDTQRG